jgi:hypothetical protein
MAYSQYNLIEAVDYNTLVGTTPDTTANRYNTVVGVGAGKSGYGQTQLSQVAQGDKVTATNWASLITKTATIGSHQGSAITALTPPTLGDKVSALAPLVTNVTNIYTGRNNATLQGTSVPTETTQVSTWIDMLTFTNTVSFASGNAARYFFNAGGQIALTFYHPTGAGTNGQFSLAATNAGTIVISSPNSGTVNIVGTTYNGVSKIGGSGVVTTLSTNSGYYGLLTSSTEIYKQFATAGALAGYSSSYLSVSAYTNGAQGANSDNGSQITIKTIIDSVPNGFINSAGTKVTCTIRPPSTSYITNTWGAITVVGTVAGS